MRKTKKLLSLLLCAAMVCTGAAMPVATETAAAEKEQVEDDGLVMEIPKDNSKEEQIVSPNLIVKEGVIETASGFCREGIANSEFTSSTFIEPGAIATVQAITVTNTAGLVFITWKTNISSSSFVDSETTVITGPEDDTVISMESVFGMHLPLKNTTAELKGASRFYNKELFVEIGAEVKVKAKKAKKGMHFDSWQGLPEEAVVDGDTAWFTMPLSSILDPIEPKYVEDEADTYKLSVVSGSVISIDGKEITDSSSKTSTMVEAGAKVVLQADEVTGKEFVSWTGITADLITSGTRKTSRVAITMPEKKITAVANYKDAKLPDYPENPGDPKPPATPGAIDVPTPGAIDTDPPGPVNPPTPEAISTPTPAPGSSSSSSDNNDATPTSTPAPTVVVPTPAPSPVIIPSDDSKKTIIQLDGTKVETEKTTDSNGNTTVIQVSEKPDGAKTETKEQISSDGKNIITVKRKLDADGKEKEASIKVEQVVANDKLTVDVSSLLDFATIVVGDAKNANVAVSFTAKNKNGEKLYTVSVDSTLLKKRTLKVYEKKKNGNYVMVEKEFTCNISEDGQITLNIPEAGNYQLVSNDQANKIDREIKASVQPAKKTAKVAEGKEVQFKLDKGCNQGNITKITYSSSNKNVKVDKNGNIKAKDEGTAVVKAKVKLLNGKTKTVKMKIVVK